ncbi:MAG: hypothetical protein ACOZBL_02590 [Patescibacteria group bacterium]
MRFFTLESSVGQNTHQSYLYQAFLQAAQSQSFELIVFQLFAFITLRADITFISSKYSQKAS